MSEEFFKNGQISCVALQTLGFTACSIILFYEFRNRSKITAEEKKAGKWLHLIAILSLFSSTLSQILMALSKFPSTILKICPFTIHLGFFLYWSKYIFLGLFQIKRLDCIAQQEIQMFGRSKLQLMVKFLYLGAFIASIGCISMTGALIVTDYGTFGCTLTYTATGIILNFPVLIIYLCWDVSTLIVYIVKLSQYRQTVTSAMERFQHSNGTITLNNDIIGVLSKIILLTVIYEISFSIYAILGVIVGVTLNEYVVIFGYLWVAIDGFIAAFVVFLLQKHNKKECDAFLMLLFKCRLLICCKRLALEANDLLTDHVKQLEIVATVSYTKESVVNN